MYVHLLPNHDFTVEHMILWDAGGGSNQNDPLRPVSFHEVVKWSLKAPRALGPSTPVERMGYLHVDW